MDKWLDKIATKIDAGFAWLDSRIGDLDDGEGERKPNSIWKTTIFIGIVGTLTFHFVVTTILFVADMRSPHEPIVESAAIEFDFTDEDYESEMGKDQYVSEEDAEDKLPARERMNFKELMESYDSRSQPVRVSPDLAKRIEEELRQEIESEKQIDWNQELEEELPKPKPQQTPVMQDPEPIKRSNGPADVKVSMKGRHLTVAPPNPVYLCRGHGKVTLIIKANPMGKVVSAQVSPHGTNTNNACIQEYARKSAMMARFNAKRDAPRPQVGSMTFNFVAQ